ncbi:MAG: succinate dehydrogenase [Paracoccaceae bacterium]
MEFRLYLAQRISAMVMVPLVIGHIAVMIYAIQGGLTAEEILGRTQGSTIWALFYGTFVVAVAIHAAIGLRNIAEEWLGMRGIVLIGFAWASFWGLLAMGLYAVAAVTIGPGGS